MEEIEPEYGTEKTYHKYPRLYLLSPRLYTQANHLRLFVPFMKKAGYFRLSETVSEEIRKEYEEVYEEIMNRSEYAKPHYRVTAYSGLIIYNKVRLSKPEVVLETGVCEGFSTKIILRALEKNKKGRLVSVEVDDVSGKLKGTDTSRWKLVVGKPKENLKKAMAGLDKIDIFIHDSDHGYENMSFEFNTIVNSGKLSKNGIIMSDDVNSNEAFFEIAKKIGRKPKVFPSIAKSFGMLEMTHL